MSILDAPPIARTFTAATFPVTGDATLDRTNLAQSLELTGAVNANTTLTLPAGAYALEITNSCTGTGRLFVRKASGTPAAMYTGETVKFIVN